MKRTLDLHYPFDVKRRRPMPPLLDEEGPLITTHEGTQLSVNTGYGVAIVDSQLVNSLQRLQARTPLEVNNALVSLNLGNSLEVRNGKLEVKMRAPFLLGPEGLSLNLGAGMSMNGDQLVNSFQNLTVLPPMTYSRDTINMNLGNSLYIDTDKLQIRCVEPLSITANGLTLNVGQGLDISNGQLVGSEQKSYLQPLEHDGNQIKLNLGHGLEVINNNLKVLAVAPLNLDQFGLGINLGHGLHVDGDRLIVQPAVSPPITFDGTQIGLNTGPEFSISNNTLQIAANLPLTRGLQGLELEYGETLAVQNGKLQVRPLQPLNITNSGLQLSFGRDFELNNGVLQLSNPISTLERPLQMQNGTLSLNIGSSLIVDGENLEVKAVAPIYTSATGISIRIGEGLTVLNGSLQTAQTPVSMPLMYDQNGLMLATGKSSSIVDDLLEVRSMAPLTITDNGLELLMDPNSALTTVNSTLSILLAEPFTTTTSGLSLNLGSGLGINSGYLVNTAQALEFMSPLEKVNDQVSISLGTSLSIVNNKLEVLTSEPFEITNAGLAMRLGKGLILENGTLSVSAHQPVSANVFMPPLVDSAGTVTLSLGKGLSIENGSLVAEGLSTLPPLFKSPSNEIVLSLGKSTTIIDDSLEIQVQPPFIIDNEGLNLQLGDGLTVDNGRLAVSSTTNIIYERPLQFHNNTLTLNIGDGLHIQNGALNNSNIKYYNAPLELQGQNVSLLIGEGLGIINGRLVNTVPITNMTLLPPLVHTASGVAVNIGRGLTLLDDALIVNLTATYPLDLNDLGYFFLHYNNSLDLFGHELGVKVGKGFEIDAEGLQYNLNMPLKIEPSPTSTNGSLGLSIGQGLSISSVGDLQVDISADKGLIYAQEAIGINCDSGLTFSSNGALTVNTGPGLTFGLLGDLMVNVSHGLAFASDQTIKINTGRGLDLTGQGQLEVKAGDGLAFSPSEELEIKIARGLKYNVNRYLEVDISNQSGLAWSGNQLTAMTGPGLQISQNKINVKTGTGLMIESTGHLAINANKGLTFTNSKLEAKLGAGLTYDNAGNIIAHINQQRGIRHTASGIEAKLGPAMAYNAFGEIYNNIGRGLSVVNDQMELKLGNGLSFNSDGHVEISSTYISPSSMPPLGTGLMINEGNLTTAIGAGLQFIGNNMAVSVGNGLQINNNGQIELATASASTPPSNLGQGLKLYQGNITVSLGDGMRFNGNNIEPRINVNKGLRIENSELAVPVTNGLAYEPDGAITLKIGDGLQFETDYVVSLKHGRGLILLNGNLEPKLGSGLEFDNNNRLAVGLASGLGWNNGKIQVRIKQGLEFVNTWDMKVKTGRGLRFEGMALEPTLGAGLRFDDNGAIETTPSVGVQGLPCLTTSEDSAFNVQWSGYSAANVKLDLSLTMVGRTILGTVKFRNFKRQFGHYIHPPVALLCMLYFDSYGNLMPESHLHGDLTWYDANTVDRRFMMPSRTYYPKKTISDDITMQSDVYPMSFNVLGSCLLKIQYNCSRQNNEPNFTWSIIFTLSNFTADGDLNTGTCTFSYFHE